MTKNAAPSRAYYVRDKPPPPPQEAYIRNSSMYLRSSQVYAIMYNEEEYSDPYSMNTSERNSIHASSYKCPDSNTSKFNDTITSTRFRNHLSMLYNEPINSNEQDHIKSSPVPPVIFYDSPHNSAFLKKTPNTISSCLRDLKEVIVRNEQITNEDRRKSRKSFRPRPVTKDFPPSFYATKSKSSDNNSLLSRLNSIIGSILSCIFNFMIPKQAIRSDEDRRRDIQRRLKLLRQEEELKWRDFVSLVQKESNRASFLSTGSDKSTPYI